MFLSFVNLGSGLKEAHAEPVNEMRHSPLEDYCTKSSIT